MAKFLCEKCLAAGGFGRGNINTYGSCEGCGAEGVHVYNAVEPRVEIAEPPVEESPAEEVTEEAVDETTDDAGDTPRRISPKNLAKKK